MAEEQPQPQANPINPNYIQNRRDPAILREMIVDDTPNVMKKELAEYFNNETALTHFDEKDRRVYMCYLVTSMLSPLKNLKIRDFDAKTFKDIVKTQLWFQKCPQCGFRTQDKEVAICPECSTEEAPVKLAEFMANVTEVVEELTWPAMYNKSKAKLFVKTTRAKGGFTMTSLTSEKSEMTQNLRSSSTPYGETAKKEKKHRWF